MEYGSKEIAKAAIELALTGDRAEEQSVKDKYKNTGIKTVAIDFGDEFSKSVTKILERAVVAAKREGVISDTHSEVGAVTGATHEAISQIMNKAIGLNLGGKIAVARHEHHLSVCVFFSIGLLNLNDVVIGLAHRAL